MMRIVLMLALFFATAPSVATSQAARPNVGEPAPSFTLKDQRGQDVTFPPKGAWAVLAFYPKAGTPG